MGEDEIKYKEPHELIRERIDDKISKDKKEDEEKTFNPLEISPELKQVRQNLMFIKSLIEEPLEKGTHSETVFGVETIDPLTEVYGDNIWNRSIYTVDELCDLNESATIEQRLKYSKKKPKVDSKLMFLLLLLGFGGLSLILLFFLLPMFMGG